MSAALDEAHALIVSFFRWRRHALKSSVRKSISSVLQDISNEEQKQLQLAQQLRKAKAKENEAVLEAEAAKAEASAALEQLRSVVEAEAQLTDSLESFKKELVASERARVSVENELSRSKQQLQAITTAHKQELARVQEEAVLANEQRDCLLETVTYHEQQVHEAKVMAATQTELATARAQEIARLEALIYHTGEAAAQVQAKLLDQANEILRLQSVLHDRSQPATPHADASTPLHGAAARDLADSVNMPASGVTDDDHEQTAPPSELAPQTFPEQPCRPVPATPASKIAQTETEEVSQAATKGRDDHDPVSRVSANATFNSSGHLQNSESPVTSDRALNAAVLAEVQRLLEASQRQCEALQGEVQSRGAAAESSRSAARAVVGRLTARALDAQTRAVFTAWRLVLLEKSLVAEASQAEALDEELEAAADRFKSIVTRYVEGRAARNEDLGHTLRESFVHWRLAVHRQSAARSRWPALAKTLLEEAFAEAEAPREPIARRCAARARARALLNGSLVQTVDSKYLQRAAFLVWRALSVAQALERDADAEVRRADGLSAGLAILVKSIGLRRALERAWLSWRLAVLQSSRASLQAQRAQRRSSAVQASVAQSAARAHAIVPSHTTRPTGSAAQAAARKQAHANQPQNEPAPNALRVPTSTAHASPAARERPYGVPACESHPLAATSPEPSAPAETSTHDGVDADTEDMEDGAEMGENPPGDDLQQSMHEQCIPASVDHGRPEQKAEERPPSEAVRDAVQDETNRQQVQAALVVQSAVHRRAAAPIRAGNTSAAPPWRPSGRVKRAATITLAGGDPAPKPSDDAPYKRHREPLGLVHPHAWLPATRPGPSPVPAASHAAPDTRRAPAKRKQEPEEDARQLPDWLKVLGRTQRTLQGSGQVPEGTSRAHLVKDWSDEDFAAAKALGHDIKAQLEAEARAHACGTAPHAPLQLLRHEDTAEKPSQPPESKTDSRIESLTADVRAAAESLAATVAAAQPELPSRFRRRSARGDSTEANLAQIPEVTPAPPRASRSPSLGTAEHRASPLKRKRQGRGSRAGEPQPRAHSTPPAAEPLGSAGPDARLIPVQSQYRIQLQHALESQRSSGGRAHAGRGTRGKQAMSGPTSRSAPAAPRGLSSGHTAASMAEFRSAVAELKSRASCVEAMHDALSYSMSETHMRLSKGGAVLRSVCREDDGRTTAHTALAHLRQDAVSAQSPPPATTQSGPPRPAYTAANYSPEPFASPRAHSCSVEDLAGTKAAAAAGKAPPPLMDALGVRSGPSLLEPRPLPDPTTTAGMTPGGLPCVPETASAAAPSQSRASATGTAAQRRAWADPSSAPPNHVSSLNKVEMQSTPQGVRVSLTPSTNTTSSSGMTSSSHQLDGTGRAAAASRSSRLPTILHEEVPPSLRLGGAPTTPTLRGAPQRAGFQPQHISPAARAVAVPVKHGSQDASLEREAMERFARSITEEARELRVAAENAAARAAQEAASAHALQDEVAAIRADPAAIDTEVGQQKLLSVGFKEPPPWRRDQASHVAAHTLVTRLKQSLPYQARLMDSSGSQIGIAGDQIDDDAHAEARAGKLPHPQTQPPYGPVTVVVGGLATPGRAGSYKVDREAEVCRQGHAVDADRATVEHRFTRTARAAEPSRSVGGSHRPVTTLEPRTTAQLQGVVAAFDQHKPEVSAKLPVVSSHTRVVEPHVMAKLQKMSQPRQRRASGSKS